MNRVKWAKEVKDNAGWKCQQCGSTEFMEAHDPTGRHAEVKDGICLCAHCHDLEHDHHNYPQCSVADNIKRVSLYFPVEEYELLRKLAYERHVTMNDILRQALANWMINEHIVGCSGQAVAVGSG